MKLECSGEKMILLCSKSYMIEDSTGKQKIPCKGVSKKGLEEPMQKFTDTLFNLSTKVATNTGFRSKDNTVYTYSQEKIGFNYFYCKRKVLEDGISTVPLDITLTPWSNKIRLIERVQDPLSNLFPCQFIWNHEIFPSCEHISFTQVCKHYDKHDLIDIVKQTLDPCDIFSNVSEIAKQLYKDIDLVERNMRFSILLRDSLLAIVRN